MPTERKATLGREEKEGEGNPMERVKHQRKTTTGSRPEREGSQTKALQLRRRTFLKTVEFSHSENNRLNANYVMLP